METFDVIVIGLGVAGTACCRELARRGFHVLGIERFMPFHEFGSSHGDSRIIRRAYYEKPFYVPLVDRAFSLWRELERETNRDLIVESGGLMIGPPQSQLLVGSIRAAELHRLKVDVLDQTEIQRRFPQFCINADDIGLFDPSAAVLLADHCWKSLTESAASNNADLRYQEKALSIDKIQAGIRIQTDQDYYEARHVVLTCGPWIADLFPAFRRITAVERQVVIHFLAPSERAIFDPRIMPIFMWQFNKTQMFYGFPQIEDMIKIGLHHDGEPFDVNQLDRSVRDSDRRIIKDFVIKAIPHLQTTVTREHVCLYTNTSDLDFVIDRNVEIPNIIVCSACSGHGFKFAPTLAEGVAEMIQRPLEQPELFRPFRLSRFEKM